MGFAGDDRPLSAVGDPEIFTAEVEAVANVVVFSLGTLGFSEIFVGQAAV